MAVLVTIEVPGQTQEGYEGLLAILAEPLRQAKGFIAHGAGLDGDGLRGFELWESQEDATQFFAKYVQPVLPEGIKPKRSYLELHTLIKV